MSNNGLGDTTTSNPDTITVNAGEAITAGDAVAIDQTASADRFPSVVQLNSSSTDEDQEAGVATEDISSGSNGTIVLDGGVIANVASGISAGEHVGASSTAGQFASEDGTNILALSDEFELAAFKGQPVTFRDWNGQLRQPILLYDGSITVSVSPQEGFLHQSSPLDTMGLDRPESSCDAFN